MNAPGINFAYESGIKYKTILICDLIAREWQKNYENTRLEAYFGNKRKSPFAVIVSMIAKGDGPSGEIRTPSVLIPKPHGNIFLIFSNRFWRFPLRNTVLSEPVPSTVSTCFKPVYGQICGQNRFPKFTATFSLSLGSGFVCVIVA